MSTNFQLNADKFTKQALQLCGLLGLGRQPQNNMLQDARDLFTVMLKGLQARGVTLTQAVPLTLTLSAGIDSYPLPANLIDVTFPTTVVRNSSSSETYVDPMVYADYRIISDKTITGPPTRCYIEKLATLTAFFWSVPEQTYTWNYQGIALVPDMADGTDTPGLTQRWMEPLLWRFAYWLANANNLSQGKRLELKNNADALEAKVMGQENERRDMQMMLPPNPYGSG